MASAILGTFAVRVLTLSLLLFASSALFAQKIKVEHDHATDFSKFKTYAWTEGTPSPSPVWHQVIEATISSELEAKGLRRVAAEDADLLVAYHAASNTDFNIAQNYHPVYNAPAGLPPPVTSGPWYAGTMGGTARLVRKGTLAVHLFSKEKQALVWAATARDPIWETPKKRIEQLNQAVDKMFRDYPPKPDPKH